MSKISTFYSLKHDGHYKLQFDDETVFVAEENWDDFTMERRHSENGFFVSGVLEVDREELKHFFSTCEVKKQVYLSQELINKLGLEAFIAKVS